MDEYLCKPFDEEVLRLRIRNILSLRRKYKKMFSSSSNVEELHVKEESRDKTFITNAVNLMKEHYADAEYNLERFVRDMGYSKTLVNKKMQDLTGQPIGQFMKNYRLNVAQRMIQEGSGDVNVSEIAYAVDSTILNILRSVSKSSSDICRARSWGRRGKKMCHSLLYSSQTFLFSPYIKK
ncbi:MAG: hypothetical protein ACLUE2_15560 [Bacteroides cellulosilyticus]